MKVEKVLYCARATSVGGRDGHVVSSDHILDLDLSMPKDLGGPGRYGTNPEQLFAAGYSACFLSALQSVAKREKVSLQPTASVEAIVGIGRAGMGYGLEVVLRISLPGFTDEDANVLVKKAHETCPYSNATRGNIEVTLTVL